ncbi:hypothetical protein SLE2022_277430 [Rubroshorea leprosula]
MSNPHILVIPYPTQRHVRPLLEFSQFKVSENRSIHFVSLPDGMGVDENRNQIRRLIESIYQFTPVKLKFPQIEPKNFFIGILVKREMIQLLLEIPAFNPSYLSWVSIEGFTTQKVLFNLFQRNIKVAKKVEWLHSNSTYELEARALAAMAPKRKMRVGSSDEKRSTKMEKLLGDENLKAKALELKEKIRTSVKEGGSSSKILNSFIEWVKS